MKLIIERSGGFVASSKKPRGERDFSVLTAEQRAAVDTVMQRSPSPAPPTRSEPFTYKVQVQDEAGNKEITVPESGLPQSLKDIVSY